MVFEEFEKEVKKVVEEALDREIDEKYLEEPPKEEFGDLACTITFKLAKEKGKSPKKIAKRLKEKIKTRGIIKKTEVKGPYLNFYLNVNKAAEKLLRRVNREGVKPRFKEDKKVIVEYSSPNIGKPMHIGHLRSTIIGESLARIYDFLGNDVISGNYLGDYGTQFGKLVYAYLHWGEEEEIEEDPIRSFFDLYVKFHEEAEENPELEDKAREIFNEIEKGNEKYIEVWKRIRELSLIYFKEVYERLNIRFDHYWAESKVNIEETKEIVRNNLDKEFIREGNEGSIIADLEKYGLNKSVLIKKDGSTIYLTRDIWEAIKRAKKYDFDKNIYVVANPQKLHFKQLFKILELLDYEWAERCYHVSYGLINLPSGTISTREGKVVFLEEVLDKAKELAYERIEKDFEGKEKIAEKIGVGAVIFSILKVSNKKDIQFRWDRVLDFKGDTAPYLQYAGVRAKKILQKVEGKPKIHQYQEKEELELIRKISKFWYFVRKSKDNKQPNILANYCLDLVELFNSFYEECPINTADKKTKEKRLALVETFKRLLEKGLYLLNLKIPEKM